MSASTESNAKIEREMAGLTRLRHRLHQIPELGFEEFETAAAIRAALDEAQIEYVAGVEDAPTATIAWIGDSSKPCVALRADIDALPIVEQTGLPYASLKTGCMHACGHDGHTTTLIGTAKLLQAMADELPVCVKFIWQPAEEGGGGGYRLVKVEAIFGLHGWPGLPVGKVSTRPGPLLAATDGFIAKFVGAGCHGAFPHLGRDPIVTACEAVLNLQQFVSREIDPTEPAVVTVGIINGGTATNVIPDVATIQGTARTLSPEARTLVEEAIERRCMGIAEANGCRLELEWIEGYPPTINDPKMAEYVAGTALQALSEGHYIPAARPAMGGEDFSYYLREVPGCFFLIGVQPPGRESYPPLHSDRFDFTDSAMAVGMRMFVELVVNYNRAR
jgi:amidohydrolase